MYQINELIEIPLSRRDANMDRATDHAISYALMTFGADEDGYLTKIENSKRNTDAVVIEFVSYRCLAGMNGQSHHYLFNAHVERNESQ